MVSAIDSQVGTQPRPYPAVDSDENSSLLSDHDVDGDAVRVPDMQSGVQNIEAMTVAWTTGALVFAYIMIWLTYFVEGLLTGTTAILTPYVTSDFARHSLTPTVGILSNVMGGVTNLTLAKVLDVFGRPQGYLFCIVVAMVGLVMMTLCRSVQAYAIAQVFQVVGNNGILYSLTVFVADTSSLRNRGLMQAIVSSPNLMTCWLSGPMSSAFLGGSSWRWAFGLFTLLVPSITLPLFGLLWTNFQKAKELGLVARKGNGGSGRTAVASLVYYARQFDAVGLVLLSAGVAVLLMPFNLYTLQGWDSPLVVAMLAAGLVLVVAFAIWERYYACITLIPFPLLLDRTVFGACILSATLFVSFWCWNSFFSSYLQVVNDLDVENASYVVQSYTVCSVLCGVMVGALIHYTGRFKPVCLYIGIPLSILGSAFMMYLSARQGGVGYMVMCQILISIAAGTIMVCDEVAVLAAASHQHVAVCLAVLGMFGNIGGAVGLTVASAIWQRVFPSRLRDYLPAEELPNLDKIYADISTQLSYPVASPARLAIQHAYGDAQMRMLAVGTSVWVVGLVAVMLWRDINVIGVKQNKGHVW